MGIMSVLGKRLKQLRDEKKKANSKFTQGYVANLIGVARVTYTAYENGTKQPPIETVNKLADIFEVTTDYLQGRTNNPKPPNEQDDKRFSSAFHDFDNLTEEEKDYLDLQLEIFRKMKNKNK